MTSWDAETEQMARSLGVDVEGVNAIVASRRAGEQAQRAAAHAQQEKARQLEVLRAAYHAIYEEGAEWGAVANAVAQQAPMFVDDFREMWGHETGEFDPPATPYEWDVQREADQDELDRVADMIEAGKAEAEERAAAERANALTQRLVERPLGEQLAPAVLQTFEQIVNADGVESIDVASALDLAYDHTKAHYDVADDAAYHAAQSKPFRSTEMADGWLMKPESTAERFPKAQDVAAQRQAEAEQREAELYRQNASAAVTGRLTPQPTEAQLAQEATERFKEFNAKRVRGDALVKGERSRSAAKDAVSRVEQGHDHRVAVSASMEEADNAARQGRQRRDFWNETTDERSPNN